MDHDQIHLSIFRFHWRRCIIWIQASDGTVQWRIFVTKPRKCFCFLSPLPYYPLFRIVECKMFHFAPWSLSACINFMMFLLAGVDILSVVSSISFSHFADVYYKNVLVTWKTWKKWRLLVPRFRTWKRHVIIKSIMKAWSAARSSCINLMTVLMWVVCSSFFYALSLLVKYSTG